MTNDAMKIIPAIKYQHKIMQLGNELKIKGIDIFSVFIYLRSGKFTWVSNFPKAAEDYAKTGLYRADITQSKQFRKDNRVIFPHEYETLDPIQTEITAIMRKHNFYRLYCLSRICRDCSLLLCSNRAASKEKSLTDYYTATVDAFENFCCYFIDNSLDMFIEFLPELKSTRFMTDKNYRHIVIKNRNNPPKERLTSGEVNVLYWAAQGKTAEETSILLGLTKNTLETYRKRAIAKLNATNITHAVYLAQLYDYIV